MTAASAYGAAGAGPGSPKPPPHLAIARASRERARPAVHELRVARISKLSPDAVSITFTVPPSLAEAYRFRAGQHVTVLWGDAGQEIRRSYSICAPESGQELTIAVKRLAGGTFSTYANEKLSVGDRLRVMTPTGRFVTALDARRRARYAAIAAGSGITPILSMTATILEAEPSSQVTLIYQNRTQASSMFSQDLRRLEVVHAGRLRVHHIWTREVAPNQLVRGRLDQAKLSLLLDHVMRGQEPGDIHEWLLCGPAGLMDDVSQVLMRRDVPLARIRRELFHDPHPDADDTERQRAEIPLLTSEVTIRAGGAASRLSLSSHGESILSASVRLLPDLPYSCQDGVCATCRARVISGQVVMLRCSGLDQREQEDGYVLTCQAHPVTPSVLLDFDA